MEAGTALGIDPLPNSTLILKERRYERKPWETL
jgi:hypothetical protein